MSSLYKVAVVGATGSVGMNMLRILDEREFPVSDVVALASKKSKGKKVSFGEETVLEVQDVMEYDFAGTDIVFSSISSELTRQYINRAVDAGCLVIDNSSAFRMDNDVALVVPEINLESIEQAKNKSIIASPNCVAIPLSMILHAINKEMKIKRVVVSTYQSVSGAGRKAMDEFHMQIKQMLMNLEVKSEVLPRQIACNVIPQIGEIDSKTGFTGEEDKIINEVKKIVDNSIEVTVTAVRVPVFVGHSMSINIEFIDDGIAKNGGEADLATKVADVLDSSRGISLMDDRVRNFYATPLDVRDDDNVLVSRIRNDASVPVGVSLWAVSNNMTKGAALNTIQIAESLEKCNMVKAS